MHKRCAEPYFQPNTHVDYYTGPGASGDYPAHQDYTSDTQYNTTTTVGEYFLFHDGHHLNEVNYGVAQGLNHDANSRSQQSNWLNTDDGPAIWKFGLPFCL